MSIDPYFLDLPPKERVNRLLRHNDVENQPIAFIVYDIIKWIEASEEKRDAYIAELEQKIKELSPE